MNDVLDSTDWMIFSSTSLLWVRMSFSALWNVASRPDWATFAQPLRRSFEHGVSEDTTRVEIARL